MRVLHLNTGNSGGAAQSAKLLSEALNKDGHKSELMNLTKPRLFSSRRRFSKICGKFNTLLFKRITFERYGILTPISFSQIDFKKIKRFQPDIIHIHNWYNLLSFEDIRILSYDYQVVFTMHDARLSTGGCHITMECRRYLDSCANCPAIKFGTVFIEWNRSRENAQIQKLKRFAVIAPSKWMYSVANGTQIGQRASEITIISNLIDPLFFDDLCPDRSFTQVDLRFLFVAANFETPIKGLDILIEALNLLVSSDGIKGPVSLDIIGNGNLRKLPKLDSRISLKLHGTRSSAQIRNLMLESTMLVAPSRSDNLPSVVVEGLLAGVAVLASNVGGIPDLIQNGVSGFLFDPNPKSLLEAIKNALKSDVESISQNAQEYARMHFRSEYIVGQHVDLYSRILKTHD